MINPTDDLFHPRSDDPHWGESAWHSFMVPDRLLSGMVYFFHRPNMGYSVGGVALWDPTGHRHDDCVWYDMGEIFPLPPSAEMYDFMLPNGLASECEDPLHRYHFTYKSDGCTLDLSWRSIMEPHDTGLPKGQEDYGLGHYDQAGRMNGFVEVDGQTLPIDCWSMRDHSWGPRRLVNNPRAQFEWAIASEDDAFLLININDLPPAEDPIIGTTERVITGWHMQDGVVASISDGTSSTTERGTGGDATEITVDCADSIGRPLQATGRSVNMLDWPVYSFIALRNSAFRWNLHGREAFGECQEWFPLAQRRAFARSQLG